MSINKELHIIWKQKVSELQELLLSKQSKSPLNDDNLSHNISTVRINKYFTEIEHLLTLLYDEAVVSKKAK